MPAPRAGTRGPDRTSGLTDRGRDGLRPAADPDDPPILGDARAGARVPRATPGRDLRARSRRSPRRWPRRRCRRRRSRSARGRRREPRSMDRRDGGDSPVTRAPAADGRAGGGDRPRLDGDDLARRSAAVSLSSPARIRQPPSGARPDVPMSPPRLTRTPPSGAAARAAAAARSDASALPVEPRSSSTPAGTRTVLVRASRLDRLPAGDRPQLTWIGASCGRPGEVIVVADDPHRPPDRRIHRAVGLPSDARAIVIACHRSGLTGPLRAGRGLEAHQLAVGTKATVGGVDVGEHALDDARAVARSPSRTNRCAFVPRARQSACWSTVRRSRS